MMMIIELWFWWERKLWQYLINDTQQHSVVHRYKKELWWGVIYAHTYAHTYADNILNINLDNKSTIKSKRFPYGPCYVQNSISERCGLYKGTTVWFMQRPCKSSMGQNQHPVLFFTLSLSKETYWLGDTEERLDFFPKILLVRSAGMYHSLWIFVVSSREQSLGIISGCLCFTGSKEYSDPGLYLCVWHDYLRGFPDGSVLKNPPGNAGDVGLIPGSGRSPVGGYGNTLQYSCHVQFHGQRSLAWQAPRVSHDWATNHPCMSKSMFRSGNMAIPITGHELMLRGTASQPSSLWSWYCIMTSAPLGLPRRKP